MSEGVLALVAVIGGWYILWRIPKAEKRKQQREADLRQAMTYLDACYEIIRRSKPVAVLVSKQLAVSIDVVHLLFELKRRELKGTANQMFSLKVWGYGGPNPLSFLGERYDYKTGKPKLVRKHNALKLALSPEAKGLFEVYTQPIRGGSIWKGLRLTENGQKALVTAMSEVRGVADLAA